MTAFPKDAAALSASLWPATARAFDRGVALSGEKRVDVAIVGAGYAGLSAALHLAQMGREVAVVEVDRPGAGASGRNAAGWLPAYFDRTPDNVEALFGLERGRALNTMVTDGARLVPDLIEAHGMNVDMRRSGILVASGRPAEAEGMRALAALWNDRGGRVDFVGSADVRSLSGSSRFSHGLVFRDGGTLQPFAYATGLAVAASDAGAVFYCGQPATGIEPLGDRWRLKTQGGALIASRILIATEGYEANATLWPGLERCCYHVPMAMIASEPSPEIAARMMPAGIPIADTNKSNPFWSMADGAGRIVASLLPPRRDTMRVADVARAYEDKLRWLYPDIPMPRWSHFWTGMVAISAERIPRLLALAEGVHALGGFSGQGIGAATAAGREYARLVESDDASSCRLPIFAPRPVRLRDAVPFLVRHVAAPLGRAFDRSYRADPSPLVEA